MTIKVLIADDHPVVRSGVRNELAYCNDIQVVGEAVNGEEALEMVKQLHPDVLLLDLNMPGMKAVHVMRTIREMPSSTNVLVLTAYGDPENVLGALKAGAGGFLLKDSDPTEIVTGVRAVAAGRTWIDPEVAGFLLEDPLGGPDLPGAEDLSEREAEVLRLVGQGFRNPEIAERLAISEGTVKNHITNIYEKLDLHHRAEAVVWAWQNGLVEK